jgi:eukaryotic-like serine/threonine-protein kinase
VTGHEAASAAPSAGSAADLEFLRRRLTGFAVGITCLAGFFLALRGVAELLGPSAGRLYLVPQTVSLACFVALWIAARRLRSLSALRFAELVLLGGGCVGLAVMTAFIPYHVRPDYILVLAFGLIFMLRAIWVPTTPRRTLALGLTVVIPALVVCWLIHLRGHRPELYTDLAPDFLRTSPTSMAIGMTAMNAGWWVVILGIATATSRVVHGLRREVRDARKLGQYTLGARLGAGGMGEVYRARHAMLRRPTAIKLLPPDKIGHGSLARFEREVQLTARLTHPNTIRVYDYGRTPDGVFYYAMELLDGADLAQVVKLSGPMPPARAIRILTQAASALVEAHGIGLIHRDIKPANILLTEQGGELDVAKLVDFGLVKDLARADGLSQAEGMAGTPQYMAPEAFTAPDDLDPRVDLYALGAVGYFLVTGADVFAGKTVVEIAGHHMHSAPVPPSRRAGRPLPEDLEAVLLACLAKDRADRPATARELVARLTACADAGGWREEDARAFWAEHGATLRRGRPGDGDRDDDAGGATAMAIDLASRQAGGDDTDLAAAPTVTSDGGARAANRG